MGYVVLYGFYILAYWMIRRDVREREGVSKYAIWVPTLWVGILASRPVSAWLGSGGGESTMEGSPIDRLFFFGSILASIIILAQRRVNWGTVFAKAWPIFFFYFFLLISVSWANDPIVSFKRWFKDFGNVFVALVILTEKNPYEAFKAAFIRPAYLLLPLSYIYVRWFPDMGRYYSSHGGEMQVTGVTFQKNSLGALIVICGIVLVWEWLEKREYWKQYGTRYDRWKIPALIMISAYLLYLCDSQTSMGCLVLSAAILCSTRVNFFRKRIRTMGTYAAVGTLSFLILDKFFDLKEFVVVDIMGRNMTFTGRTDVWEVLFALKTDPLLGTGFCSFWDNDFYKSKLPDWVAFSAHNGYIEMYLDGGMLGVCALGVMLLGIGLKLNSRLRGNDMYSLVCFSVLVATIIGNLSESHYARMSPLWFMFLLVSLDPRWLPAPATAPVEDYQENPEVDEPVPDLPASPLPSR